MMFWLMKRIVRIFPDKYRLKLLVVCLMESALVRPGQSIDVHLNFEKDGSYTYDVK